MKNKTKETKSNAAELFERGRQIIRETKTETPPAAVPDWVNETPAEAVYSLEMWDSDSTAVEEIYLTRGEYTDLKQHLATMRGITPTPPPAEPAATEDKVDIVAWFAEIEEANHGAAAPAESFIRHLVMVSHFRPLTPDEAATCLEEFREEFDGMAETARAFTARYPEAVNPAA
jgi:hypothetical protein